MIYIKLFILLSLSTSCANYVNRIHDQIDKESNQGKYTPEDKFALYKNPKAPRGKNSLKNKSHLFSEGQNLENSPTLQQTSSTSQSAPRRRYTSNDLKDSSQEGSLWVSQDSNAFLFSDESQKKSGDIIVLNVEQLLKNEITTTLKRAFPTQSKKTKQSPNEAKTADTQGPAPASAGQDDKSGASSDAVYDKISSVIVEEVNRDHLLLRGRKSVLYNGQKRTIEVQALVSRKNIQPDDSVSSDEILESSVTVIK